MLIKELVWVSLFWMLVDVIKAEDSPLWVSLRFQYDGSHFCSGARISADYILTTAQCVLYPYGGYIPAHVVDVYMENSTRTIIHNVSDIIHHPDYKIHSVQNNFAVLKLKGVPKTNVPYHEFSLINSKQDTKNCSLLYWNYNENELQNVTVNVEPCEIFPSDILCSINISTCQGGAPLVCNNFLAGIVSGNHSCGKTITYSSISSSYAWIKQYSSSGIVLSTISISADAKKPRIVGGTKVENITEFSYQVSIQYNGQHICGGTIIDKNHVLTAAHCCVDGMTVLDSSAYSIVAGTLNIKVPDTTKITKKVKYIFVHEEYNNVTIVNDIALMRIDDVFTPFNDAVGYLNVSTETPADNAPCKLSGWGVTQFGNQKVNPDLMYINIPILNKSACKTIMGQYSDYVTSNMLCAYASNIDACQGDSGGPLVCNGEVNGIVSWGIKCAETPGIYTNVAKYLDWIGTQQLRSSGYYAKPSVTALVITYLIVFIRNRQ